MELRPGNAGSNTASGHISGLSAALAQVPAAFRRRVIVRLDGAGASHAFIEHMTGLEIPGVELLFTCRESGISCGKPQEPQPGRPPGCDFRSLAGSPAGEDVA